MSQEKKPGYALHPALSLAVTRHRQKERRGSRKKTMKETLAHFASSVPELVGSLDWFILGEEWFWRNQGREVVFPEGAAVLDALQRAKFDLGQEGLPGMEMPFSSFVLAIPKGYQPEPGVDLRAILVTWETYERFVDHIYNPFGRWVGIPEVGETTMMPHQPGERALSIVTCLNVKRMEYLRTLMLESKIPAVLSARTPEEFMMRVGDYRQGGLEHFADLDPVDQRVQFYAVRLVCALAVFHQATEGRHLLAGFPGGQHPRVLRGDPLRETRHWSLTGVAGPSRDTPAEHYRAWHFRQLRDERYYRGEHRNKPRGSRWVFVSDTTVSERVRASTQASGRD